MKYSSITENSTKVLSCEVSMGGILTKRQAQVCGLLMIGLTDKHIARVLNVEPFTIKAHVEAAKKRTGAKNRAELVSKLWYLGLVKPSYKVGLCAWLSIAVLVCDASYRRVQRPENRARVQVVRELVTPLQLVLA